MEDSKLSIFIHSLANEWEMNKPTFEFEEQSTTKVTNSPSKQRDLIANSHKIRKQYRRGIVKDSIDRMESLRRIEKSLESKSKMKMLAFQRIMKNSASNIQNLEGSSYTFNSISDHLTNFHKNEATERLKELLFEVYGEFQKNKRGFLITQELKQSLSSNEYNKRLEYLLQDMAMQFICETSTCRERYDRMNTFCDVKSFRPPSSSFSTLLKFVSNKLTSLISNQNNVITCEKDAHISIFVQNVSQSSSQSDVQTFESFSDLLAHLSPNQINQPLDSENTTNEEEETQNMENLIPKYISTSLLPSVSSGCLVHATVFLNSLINSCTNSDFHTTPSFFSHHIYIPTSSSSSQISSSINVNQLPKFFVYSSFDQSIFSSTLSLLPISNQSENPSSFSTNSSIPSSSSSMESFSKVSSHQIMNMEADMNQRLIVFLQLHSSSKSLLSPLFQDLKNSSNSSKDQKIIMAFPLPLCSIHLIQAHLFTISSNRRMEDFGIAMYQELDSFFSFQTPPSNHISIQDLPSKFTLLSNCRIPTSFLEQNQMNLHNLKPDNQETEKKIEEEEEELNVRSIVSIVISHSTIPSHISISSKTSSNRKLKKSKLNENDEMEEMKGLNHLEESEEDEGLIASPLSFFCQYKGCTRSSQLISVTLPSISLCCKLCPLHLMFVERDLLTKNEMKRNLMPYPQTSSSKVTTSSSTVLKKDDLSPLLVELIRTKKLKKSVDKFISSLLLSFFLYLKLSIILFA